MIYDHLPRQRQLNSEEKIKMETEKLLKLKVNKKLLQQHLSKKTKKIVTLKDISNIQTQVNKQYSNDLESLVATLRGIEG